MSLMKYNNMKYNNTRLLFLRSIRKLVEMLKFRLMPTSREPFRECMSDSSFAAVLPTCLLYGPNSLKCNENLTPVSVTNPNGPRS